jgi:hypothetical protein
METAKPLQIIAQGFSPGTVLPKRFALKERPSWLAYYIPLLTANPSCERNTSAANIAWSAALSGRFCLLPNPGLKPWANLLCPFGANIANRPMANPAAETGH